MIKIKFLARKFLYFSPLNTFILLWERKGSGSRAGSGWGSERSKNIGTDPDPDADPDPEHCL